MYEVWQEKEGGGVVWNWQYVQRSNRTMKITEDAESADFSYFILLQYYQTCQTIFYQKNIITEKKTQPEKDSNEYMHYLYDTIW